MSASHKAAVELLEAFKAQDISRFRNIFLYPFAFLLTNYRVKSLLDTANFLLGPLESWTEPQVHQQGRVTVYKTLANFQRGQQALTLKVWGNKALGVGVPAAMDVGLSPPWSTPAYADPSTFNEQEVTVRPYWLWPATKGTLNIPKSEKPARKPAVLFVPGSGVLDRDATVGGTKHFKDLSHGLATAGFVTLRMDKPGAIMVFRQMVTKNITLTDEYIVPLSAALKYLASHPSVDPENIFLLGGSLGGMVAPRLAKASPVPIKGIISCAGASLPIDQALVAQLRLLNEHFPRSDQSVHEKEVKQFDELRRVIESGGPKNGETDPTKDLPFPLPLTYLKDQYENDPVEVAKGLETSMLFLHGKRDWQVGMDQYERWHQGLSSSQAGHVFKLYDDVGHTMTPVDGGKFGTWQYAEPAHVKEELLNDIVDFIRNQSGAGSP